MNIAIAIAQSQFYRYNTSKNKKGVNDMYLDPGFGGMLLQAIVAIVAVSGAILYSFRRKIKELFTKKTESSDESTKPLNVENLNELQEDAIDMLEESSTEEK